RGATSRVLAVTADVSKPGDVRRAVQQTLARFGRIDVLVNNAGISGRGRVEDLSERDWDRVLSVNLRGAFLCARAVLPSMKRQRRGYIVNISSLAGKIGMAGSAAYCASKFGLVGLSQSIGEEGAPWNIRATAICPAYVNTPMVRGAPVDPSRMIQPQDIAATVRYLLELTDYAVEAGRRTFEFRAVAPGRHRLVFEKRMGWKFTAEDRRVFLVGVADGPGRAGGH